MTLFHWWPKPLGNCFPITIIMQNNTSQFYQWKWTTYFSTSIIQNWTNIHPACHQHPRSIKINTLSPTDKCTGKCRQTRKCFMCFCDDAETQYPFRSKVNVIPVWSNNMFWYWESLWTVWSERHRKLMSPLVLTCIIYNFKDQWVYNIWNNYNVVIYLHKQLWQCSFQKEKVTESWHEWHYY